MSRLPIDFVRLCAVSFVFALSLSAASGNANAASLLADKTVADATGGATAQVQLWRRDGDGAVFPRVDTKTDGICAHAAVLWHHDNGNTYTDHGSWVCGTNNHDGPKDKPARNWRDYRSVSLAAFVDGRNPVAVPLYDFGALETHAPAEPARPENPVIVRDDEDCRAKGKHLNQYWTARFGGSRHEIGRNTQKNPPTGVPQTPEETLELVYFPVGDVRIGPVTTCKTNRGWGIRTPIEVAVDSAGLTATGKPKGSRSRAGADGRMEAVARGWGMGLAGGNRTTLRFKFFECEESKLWKTLGIASWIPIPKAKVVVKLGQFAARLILRRDRIRCSDWGTRDLRLMVEPDGDLTVRHERDKTSDLTQRGQHRVLWDLPDPELKPGR